MRTIKFRVWDKKRSRYLFPYPRCDGNGTIPSFLIAGNGSLVMHSGRISYPTYDEENYIVQQFTGFKDKNGKEIYEGDIFNSTAVYYKWDPVEFENGMFQANLRGARIYHLSELFENDVNYNTVEVIGNIHENPELIP